MPISHTNRKGQTYFLHQGITKTSKPRYFFSKTAAPDALEQVPAGHHIEESVNGIVSLVKDRQQLILPEETQLVEDALHRHPKGNNYRVSAKGKQIVVYERLGPDAEDMADIFGKTLLMYSRQELLEGMQSLLDKNAQYSPMLHFKLVNTADRTFCAERATYVSSLPEWVNICDCGPLQELVDEIIPLLDTDEYFELL
ncbi:MAG: hypothetical protein JW726_07425 [Anaerolineales bacterium]|nr:hypothetical protein [Anaerolineales bacterium]